MKNMILVVCSLILVACGGGGGGGSSSGVGDSLEVTEWAFSNETILHEGEEIPSINPATNGGQFSIYLTVNDQYWLTAYLSNDDRISGSDIVLTDGSEGCLFDDCLSNALDCSFTNDNILTCGTEERDLTS